MHQMNMSIHTRLFSLCVSSSREVVQASSEVQDSKLATPPVTGLRAAGGACCLPTVEQCVRPGVPGGP